LSMQQMTIAKNSLLAHMEKSGWPHKHVLALATFFLQLENHDKQQELEGNTILLIYQAHVRCEWNAALKAPSRDATFNIGVINDALLESISMEYWNVHRAEGVLGSVPPPYTQLTQANQYFPL
ncbi:hypothetical protein BDQ12DRAFT_619107, partial [Crucibulum laeve]